MARTARRISAETSSPMHPGEYVRAKVLMPKKMSVTEAAKHIGISRPGVSNFLNGKVGATPEMAARIERAFGIPAQTLLDLQAAFDAKVSKEKGAPASVRTYVPPFLAIKANEIETWSSHNISARSRLAVLLRTLVHSTGIGLTKVDFPGNDDAERPGWDGYSEADEGTPWIPKGPTGWEFGVNENVKKKADDDFVKSVKATTKQERDSITFIFVTTRRWPGKDDWTLAMRAKRQWRDVRAYDASDLEQWIAQSLVAQTWFSDETGRGGSGVRSLEKCWDDWANVAEPPLPGQLFDTALEAGRSSLIKRIKSGATEPTVISADSVEEGLAYVARLFKSEPDLAEIRDRVIVFDRPGILPRLAEGGDPNFVAIVHDPETERELGPLAHTVASIIVCARNAPNTEPHLTLEPLNSEGFRKALEAAGFDRDAISKLERASGRSVTVLRRQLSIVPAVKTPTWADNADMAASLVPFLFLGTWNASNRTDVTAVELMSADQSYDQLEKIVQRLVALNDAPMWSVGTFRGVISKIDLLFAIARVVTVDDLKRYFALARIVLGEDDPALDLPESDRWAASLHGKSREFSSALRRSVSGTLVLLAVYGNSLFRKGLGFDVETAVDQLVSELLTPFTLRTLEANDHDLPTYAEASPGVFLNKLERDLRSDNPEVLGLLRPAPSGMFGGGMVRSGLLWALEGLAWSPANLNRVVLILGRLARVEITDNWVNKPIHSLESIFRAWMPQTAADHDARVAAVKKLAEVYPDVGWKVCLAQFGGHHQVGDYTHKPSWRSDAFGYGEPFRLRAPIIQFMREMVDMALAWKDHTPQQLYDLIERLHGLLESDQAKVWDLIEAWVAKGPSDADKALVREKVRLTVLSRRARRGMADDFPALTAKAKQVYAALEPTDLITKHEWLFKDNWVEESADELSEDDFDFRKREARIRKLRADALKLLMKERGLSAVLELADRGNAAWQIGVTLALDVLDSEGIVDAIQAIFREANEEISPARRLVIGGLLRGVDAARRETIVATLGASLSADRMVSLLLLAPFARSSWQRAQDLGVEASDRYWKEVRPDYIFDDADGQNAEAVRRLIEVKRPRAAFAAVHFKLEYLDGPLLYELLYQMATDASNDRDGEYKFQEYEIETAFKLLDKSAEVSFEQKAGLEFAYVDVLAQPWNDREKYGIPNLEKYVAQHPEVFVQAIVWAYKRRNGGEDPAEWKVASEQLESLAGRGHKLLDGIEHIPFEDIEGDAGTAEFKAWVSKVRSACAELDRAEIADIALGKLFSESSKGEDGVWPSERVRDVLEEIQSEDICDGARTGLYNARGAHWRGEGGDQEREIAQRYRGWADALHYSHPFVSTHLLGRMAETYEREASREDEEARIRRRMLR